MIISCANAPVKAEEKPELPDSIQELLKEEPRFSPGDKVVAVLRIVSGGKESIVIGYVFPDKFVIGTVKQLIKKVKLEPYDATMNVPLKVLVDWGNGKITKMSPENLAHYKPKPKEK